MRSLLSCCSGAMGSTGASCELGALPLIGASCELKASNEGASGELAASVNVKDLVMKWISGLQKSFLFGNIHL